MAQYLLDIFGLTSWNYKGKIYKGKSPTTTGQHLTHDVDMAIAAAQVRHGIRVRGLTPAQRRPQANLPEIEEETFDEQEGETGLTEEEVTEAERIKAEFAAVGASTGSDDSQGQVRTKNRGPGRE